MRRLDTCSLQMLVVLGGDWFGDPQGPPDRRGWGFRLGRRMHDPCYHVGDCLHHTSTPRAITQT